MPYRNEVQPLNLFGDYLAGRDAALNQQRSQQVNALGSLRMQREQRLNALSQDPNATPEQLIRAGGVQEGMALGNEQQTELVRKQQALQQLAGIAAKALTITDPTQRKGFLQQAGQMYAPSFQALSADMSQFPAMLQMPDDQLAQKLQQVAQFAAPAPPVKLAAGETIGTMQGGKFSPAYTNEKDSAITPYQQQQLDIERQKLAQGGKANLIQMQNVTGKLRDDYTGVVNKSGWPDQQNYYSRMKSVGNDNTGASDMALIFSYMKVLDPSSAVKEGEYATAQNSGGVPAWVVGQYNKARGGGFLSDTQRGDFLGRADKIYATSYKKQEKIRTDFSEKAARAGVDPRDVLVDFGASAPAVGSPGKTVSFNDLPP